MSRYESRILKIIAAGTALATAYFALAADAQGQEQDDYRHGAEVAIGAHYAENSSGNDIEFATGALRYHYAFNERWGIEGSFTRQKLDFTRSDFFELSARFTFFQNERVGLFAFAGGGLLRYDYDYPIIDGSRFEGTEEASAYHAGIAVQIALGDRFYLRPELRQRWLIDLFGPFDEESSEATLGFGYRF